MTGIPNTGCQRVNQPETEVQNTQFQCYRIVLLLSTQHVLQLPCSMLDGHMSFMSSWIKMADFMSCVSTVKSCKRYMEWNTASYRQLSYWGALYTDYIKHNTSSI